MAGKNKNPDDRLSLCVGIKNKKLIVKAAEKDDRSMNKWATRVLRDALKTINQK